MRTSRLVAAVLLLAPALVLAADSAAIHGCVEPSGKLRIVASASECKSNEYDLSWSNGGGAAPLSVVDGGGKNLGSVVHVEDPLLNRDGVYDRSGGPISVDSAYRHGERTFLLRFLSIEPYLDGTSRVFFESCDCSGAPLIRVEPAGMLRPLFTASAIGGFHRLYLAKADAGDPRRTDVCSLLTADTGCEPAADSGATNQLVVPAEMIGQLPFAEPYHVEGMSLPDPIP